MDNTPYEKILNQIADLMQLSFDNANKPISPEKTKELERQLTDLEKKIKDLKKATDQIAAEAGVTDFSLQAMGEDPQSGVKNLLKKAQDLRDEAAKGAKDPVQAAEELKKQGKRLGASKKVKKPLTTKGRKNKFRSMGGDQDWKPI